MKNRVRREKILLMMIISVSLLFLFSIISDIPKNTARSLFSNKATSDLVVSPDDEKKRTLEQVYNQIRKYEKRHNYNALYDYLTPTEKTSKTREEYIKFRKNGAEAYNIEFVVNDIILHEDIGIIDSTVYYCKTLNCSGSERISFRSKKQYFYMDGKWYHELFNVIYCSRFEKYSMPDEFDRAIGLIIQRMKQSGYAFGDETAKNINDIRNCLDIQYAQSDDDMQGAEGLFMFYENSTPDRLQIFVSPRYQIKDDLLTAILLSHEITHAYLFATGLNKNISCYENEARAFASQMQFLGTINNEELASITYRYNYRSSQEAISVVDLIVALGTTSGNDGYQKALNYVKNSPFYQSQCAGNK